MITLLRLFWEFFKTGLFAVGGGLATLPFLSDIADKTGWFTHAQLADMVAVAESTPGPIGVNTATYVGFTTAGYPGALIAPLGLVTPSIIIILIIASLLKAFSDNRYVQTIFRLLRPVSVGLITAAGLSVARTSLVNAGHTGLIDFLDVKAVLLFVLLWIFMQYVPKTKAWHPIIFIGISAVHGIMFF